MDILLKYYKYKYYKLKIDQLHQNTRSSSSPPIVAVWLDTEGDFY